MPTCRFQEYEWDSDTVLGRGSFGAVHGGKDTRTNQSVAVKLVRKDMVLEEERIMRGLNHPNVVRLLASAPYGNDQHVMVMEFCSGGDLTKCPRLSSADIRTLTLHMAACLGYLERQHIGHRDIKPSNIMIAVGEGGEMVFKLGDFGLSRKADLFATVVGSPYFMSPEIAQNNPARRYTIEADLWSLGCTLYSVIMGRELFPANNMFEIAEMWKVPLQLDRIAAALATSNLDAEMQAVMATVIFSLVKITPEERIPPARLYEFVLLCTTPVSVFDLLSRSTHHTNLSSPPSALLDYPMHMHLSRLLRQPPQDLLVLSPDSELGVVEGSATLPPGSEVFVVNAAHLIGMCEQPVGEEDDFTHVDSVDSMDEREVFALLPKYAQALAALERAVRIKAQEVSTKLIHMGMTLDSLDAEVATSQYRAETNVERLRQLVRNNNTDSAAAPLLQLYKQIEELAGPLRHLLAAPGVPASPAMATVRSAFQETVHKMHATLAILTRQLAHAAGKYVALRGCFQQGGLLELVHLELQELSKGRRGHGVGTVAGYGVGAGVGGGAASASPASALSSHKTSVMVHASTGMSPSSSLSSSLGVVPPAVTAKELEDMYQKLAELKATVVKLQQENQEAGERQVSLESLRDAHGREMQALREAHAREFEERTATWMQCQQALQAQNMAQGAKLEDLQLMLHNAQDQLRGMAASGASTLPPPRCAEDVARIQSLERQVAAFRDELAREKDTAAARLAQTVSTLNDEKRALQEALEERTREFSRLNAITTELRKQVAAETMAKQKAMQDLSLLEGKVAKFDASMAELRQQLTNETSAKQRAVHELSIAEQRAAAELKAMVARVQEESAGNFSTILARSDALEKQLRETKKLLAQAEERVRTAEDRAKSAEKRVADRDRRISDLEDGLRRNAETIADLEERLATVNPGDAAVAEAASQLARVCVNSDPHYQSPHGRADLADFIRNLAMRKERSRCELIAVNDFSHGDVVLVLQTGTLFAHPAPKGKPLTVDAECMRHLRPPSLMVISAIEGDVVVGVPL